MNSERLLCATDGSAVSEKAVMYTISLALKTSQAVTFLLVADGDAEAQPMVWDEGKLVPFAKAYSGLSNEEIGEMDRWIRRHTVERFGPVRHVEPVHVFELGFEGIARSTRHKSGIAVRFPRMLRWRKDKRPADADTLDDVQRLLESVERGER